MSERNYWTKLGRRAMSRRTLLRASARAGVGTAGLALVGCGDDDDDSQQTVVQAQQQDQQQAQPQARQQAQQQQQAEQQAQAVEQQEQATVAETPGVSEDFSVPWPLDEIDLDASIVAVVPTDQGGLDQMRTGSKTNQYSHGAVFSPTMEWEPAAGAAIPHLAAPEWVDSTSIVASVVPAPFHDGSILTAHDVVFSYDRMAGKAAYHQGGETTDHPGGWTPSNFGRSSANWVRNEAVDDRTWSFELPAPDAAFFVVNLAGTGEVVIMSQADTEARGDPRHGHLTDGHRSLPLRQPRRRHGLRLRAFRGPLPARRPSRRGLALRPPQASEGRGAARDPVAVGRPRGGRDRRGARTGPQ